MHKTEAARRAQAKYAANNKERIAARMVSYRLSNPKRAMLRAASNRAKKRDMEFSITEDDFELPERCPILGIPIQVNSGKKGGFGDSASLDRIDSTKGYVKGNVQVLSRRANAMKMDASPAELVAFANWIKENYV